MGSFVGVGVFVTGTAAGTPVGAAETSLVPTLESKTLKSKNTEKTDNRFLCDMAISLSFV